LRTTIPEVESSRSAAKAQTVATAGSPRRSSARTWVEVGAELPHADVVIDAIFGTGFHGEPREEAARSIEAIRNANVPVVAVDVPSGVNASTGEVSGSASTR
jgi:NAD(P)H-hydrate epimerase